MSTKKKNIGLKWLAGVTIFVAFAVGGYSLYEYLRIQKINKTVTSPDNAINIINQVIANG